MTFRLQINSKQSSDLEVYESMVDFLLVLEMFLTKDLQVEDLLCGASTCYEACLLSSDDLCLRLPSVQHDPRYDFAWMADEADRSVVLALQRELPPIA